MRITSTRTDKVPNTSATAASSGADLNGMAAFNAANTVRDRLAAFAAAKFACAPEAVRFTREGVVAGDELVPFDALCRMAHIGRISLSSTGFYATPKIEYDRASHSGRPFLYFAYGAALSEVVIDTLTGEHRVLAVDILHDVGRSLNPAIDLGQIEGGFIQGMGWLTTEELVYDDRGRLLSPRPLHLQDPDRLRSAEAYGHPPVGARPQCRGDDPPLEGGRRAALHAGDLGLLRADACRCRRRAPGKGLPRLDAPATPERILAALTELKGRDG